MQRALSELGARAWLAGLRRAQASTREEPAGRGLPGRPDEDPAHRGLERPRRAPVPDGERPALSSALGAGLRLDRRHPHHAPPDRRADPRGDPLLRAQARMRPPRPPPPTSEPTSHDDPPRRTRIPEHLPAARGLPRLRAARDALVHGQGLQRPALAGEEGVLRPHPLPGRPHRHHLRVPRDARVPRVGAEALRLRPHGLDQPGGPRAGGSATRRPTRSP